MVLWLFSWFSDSENLDLRRVKAYQKNEAIGLHNPIASRGHPRMGLE